MTLTSTWIPVVAPLVGALLVVLLRLPSELRRWVALLGPALALGSTCAVLVEFDPNVPGVQFASTWDWLPEYGLRLGFGVDRTSLPLLLLSSLVGFCAILATCLPSRRAAQEGASELGAAASADRQSSSEHEALLLVTIAAANGAFAASDLFFFYVFAELTTLPKYLLIARWARSGAAQANPSQVALRATIYVLLGALVLLAAIAILASVSPVLAFEGASAALASLEPNAAAALYVLAALAFALWSGLWPLHSWAPPVYTTALAPTNMLFGGVAKMFGLYGLLRLSRDVLPGAASEFALALTIIGAINVLYGAWVALREKDWNRILAFASISHAGYTLIAIGVGSETTAAVATLLMLSHGLVTALGFVLTDELEWAAGSRDSSALGGVAKALPVLGVAFMALAVAGAGVPGSVTFAAELGLFVGAWADGMVEMQPAIVAAMFGVVLCAAYLFTPLHATFFGEARPGLTLPVRAVRRRPIAAAVVLVAALFGLGVFPRVVTESTMEASR